MNKTKFRLLVFFMSLSLIGIILVQLYWVNSSLKNSDEQLRFHISHILSNVNERLNNEEAQEFISRYNTFKDSVGEGPISDFLDYYKKQNRQPTHIIYSDNVLQEDYSEPFFENDIEGVRKKGSAYKSKSIPNETAINRYKDRLQRFEFETYLEEYRLLLPIEKRISEEKLKAILKDELEQNDVFTPFEFAVYNNELPTKIKSDKFKLDKATTYDQAIFSNGEKDYRYHLMVSFPEKQTFLFSSIVPITSLSLVFTLIIIIAYLSAISQLVKQKQISEIKTDFINNMTHEFKTPIATINLALDSIRNPKIFEDKEKVQRYLQMIRDENKRMHAQVENVLQISKLDKKELDIPKEQADIHKIIEDAVEHVRLIIEARGGTLTRHFEARRTTTLLNDMHFTNVFVNILDNAIKYSPDEPVIDIYTENVKDFILIKIKDHGMGMSKVTLKRIFEKFYREHTGDLHNVKGHGLGLAYVKRIIDDHNCNIYVESEKGKGSTFIIKMPLIN
ncbi:HAMP domain-containing histidine kinase [Flavobacterium sp. J372]|uniref:sensor histidine kinase n=1 Tax=Flavobacterium sp. J372 TaxID=2898436 RepID=UPI002151318B|nr:HAMP domain-containing sensor histidine kinase [Flavobacterium sp. J372]MCR5862207.1 HAMP domain-containing histidine kinase [Flavobacterium sp. J372]